MSSYRTPGGRPQPDPSPLAYPAGPAVDAEASPGGLGLGQVFQILRRRWWMVVLGAVLAFGAAWYLVPEPTTTYRANAVVRLDDARRALAGGLAGESGENIRSTEFMVSQVHVLRSRALVGEVVDRLGLRLQGPEGFPTHLLQEISIATGPVRDTIWIDAGAGGTYRVRAGATDVQAAYGTPVEVGGVRFALAGPVEQERPYLTVLPREMAIDMVLLSLNAVPRERAAIIDIMYRSGDAARTAQVVNAVADAYQAQNARGVQELARRRREFVEEQMVLAQGKFEQAQQALSDYRSRGRLYSSQERLQTEQAGLMNLEVQRDQLESERRMITAFLARVERAPDASFDQEVRALISSPSGAPASPIISQLFGQLVQYQTEREGHLAAGRSTTHPDVERLTALIATTRTNLIAAARSHVSSIDLRIAGLADRRDRSAETIRSLPDSETEELRLAQDAETARRSAEMLRDEYQRARMAEAVGVGQVEILDYAMFAAPQAAGRRTQKLAIALFFGLMLGSGGALLLETTNASIRRRGEMEGVLNAPVLGMIPHLKTSESQRPLWRRALPGRSNGAEDGAGGGVLAFDFHSVAAEAYRMLRTNLVFLNRDRELKTLVVSSASSGEGKTTTAANLAAAFARQGKKVLLVDCDLRRPRLHGVFGIERDPGFVDLILGEATAAEVVRPTSVNRLYVMTRGRFDEGVTEMLSGGRMKRFLSTFGSRFDLILLDTSPVMLTADAASVGAMADGVLLVVRAGHTHREAARQTMRQLQMVGAEVVGVVLNDPESVTERYGEYAYSRQYYSVET